MSPDRSASGFGAPRRESHVRGGGDACPGALRLHAADDGALARIRLPAGVLTARQAEVLGDAAERLGDGRLDLTSRGNVQIRGLDEGCGAELAALLRQAGLLPSERHERVRNIVASPLAGLDTLRIADELSDVHEWARRLDGLLCASTRAAELSGRFLFALDDGRGDVAALGADVTLLAEVSGTALLRVGDGPGGLRVAGEDAPRAALVAAEAFLTAVGGSGASAWRVRELPESHALTASRLARTLARTGVTADITADITANETANGTNPADPVEPVEPVGPAGPAEVVMFPHGRPPLPGLVESATGAWTLSAVARLGRLTVKQWRLLARIAEQDGTGELRVTPWRGVLVPGLRDAATARERLSGLEAAGLVTDARSPWLGVSACAGRPGCARSRSDIRADAASAVTAPVTGAALLPVHWSGCERRCGHPAGGAWVDVTATGDDCYQVSVCGAPHERTTTVTAAGLADATAAARATT